MSVAFPPAILSHFSSEYTQGDGDETKPHRSTSERIGDADGVGPVNCGLGDSDGMFVSPTNA